MMRWFLAMTAVTTLVAATGCDSWGREGYDPPPGAPSLLPAWGARETNGQLRIWLGTPCSGITEIALTHGFAGPELVLVSTDPAGANVEHLTLGGPYPGLRAIAEWPAGTDWRSADQLLLQTDGVGAHFGASSKVSDIVAGSSSHAEDTYWFEGLGWLTPADVAAQNGKTFATFCTPNPPAR
jgi:hypothetical protein